MKRQSRICVFMAIAIINVSCATETTQSNDAITTDSTDSFTRDDLFAVAGNDQPERNTTAETKVEKNAYVTLKTTTICKDDIPMYNDIARTLIVYDNSNKILRFGDNGDELIITLNEYLKDWQDTEGNLHNLSSAHNQDGRECNVEMIFFKNAVGAHTNSIIIKYPNCMFTYELSKAALLK